MILGFLQGVTEFLPVSSSGHLVVCQRLFGLGGPGGPGGPGGLVETGLFFEIMVHFGTLLAVLVVFRSDIAMLAVDTWRTITGKADGDRRSFRLVLLIAAGTIPAALFGLGWKDVVADLFSEPFFVGCAFLVTGFVLWLSRLRRQGTKNLADMTWIDAALIGLGQALALIPGVSRSGTTISIGLMLGLDRRLAARYSFLLAVPAILGAVAVQIGETDGLPAGQWTAVAAGTVMAALSGYVALKLLLRIVIAGNLSRFSYYCWGIGLLTLGGVLSGAI